MGAQGIGLCRTGVRVADSTVETIDAAFNRGEVVRSWPMRGTLHAFSARDAAWLVAFFGDRNRRRIAARQRFLGIDEREVTRARGLAEKLLARGPATREVLLDALERGGVPTGNQRGVHLVWSLAQLGVLALGPVIDDEHAFVLLDAWVKKPRRLTGDEALGELAARYFAGHGPATVSDLAFWTGLNQGESKRAMEIASINTSDVEANAVPKHHALLLPAFDEYFLGYRNRDAVLDPKWFDRVVPGGNGVFQPLLVVGGRVVGTWKRSVQPRRVQLELLPFEPLTSSAGRALESAAHAFARFYQRPVELEFTAPRAKRSPRRASPAAGSRARRSR
ncbi:MAG: winged helix DNA-binding domain-containing protein [Myxococcaceae bacterium]